MAVTLAHRGICVSQIDRACDFYARALGFSPVTDGAFDAQVLGQLTGHADVRLHSQVVRDGSGVSLELVQFVQPPSSGARERRALNQYGLTHFCFWTPCIEETAKIIELHGGVPHWHTLVSSREMNTRVMYCSDPDGVRIELGERKDQPMAFLHSALCAGDVAQTIDFYSQLLGFQLIEQLELRRHASWLAPLMELPDVSLSAYVLVSAQGDRVELLECYQPPPFGTREAAAPNRFGLSHMTFTVPDLDRTAELASRLGAPRAFRAGAGVREDDALICNDPDGITLILLEHRG